MVLQQSDKLRIVVKWLAEQKGVSMSKIGEMIGYNSASAFSQVLNSKKKIPPSLPERIAALDPRVNIDFLTGDSQDMILGEEQAPAPIIDKRYTPREGVYLPPELIQMFADLSAAVRSQQDTISILIRASAGETIPKKDVG